MLQVTCDQNADLKRLRQLEIKGLIQLYGVAIEEIKNTRRIKSHNKELPIAVIDSEFSIIGSCVIASDETPYLDIESVIGKQHHADVLHLERHIESKRDIFVTNDNDFLTKRHLLEEKFGTQIMTNEELEVFLLGGPSGVIG